MVSYYNSLAMFPNRHAPQSSSPAAAAAAAAAAYLGYHGYHHPHHPHHHVQPSPPASAPHHQPHHLHHNHHLGHHQYENHEMGGGHPMAPMNHQHHHQYAPPTPPSQFDHSPHHHQHHHVHLQQEGESPAVTWHSPVYSSREGYEGWSPQMQPPMAPGGSPPPPSSVTPDYKLTPDFSMASPAVLPMGPQQPQDLSNGSSGVPLAAAGPALQHSSPDSGLAGSSDGVSSSAGSPQHMHQLQHQMHPQMGHQGTMHLPMQPAQQVLLQVEEMRQQQQQPQAPPQTQTEQQPRPQPVRSPYEWMKKPSYQSQPNPVEACMTFPCLVDGQNADLPGKTRTKDKYRVVYSDRQRLELEKEFHYSRYITIRRKSELASALGLSDRQVKIWFQNRRAKERKHLKKREEVSQKDKLEPEREQQMPPDLIPPQLSIPLHHSQHLHHHHPDMAEVQQPPMGLQMPGVAAPGVDL